MHLSPTAPPSSDPDAMAGVVGYANTELSKNYVEPGISAEASNMLGWVGKIGSS